MQFTSVLAVLSVALAASANPIVVERTGTPAQQAQQQCGNTATAKCCNSKKGLLTLGNCNDINLLAILPSSVCSPTQQVACCPNSGTQTGLINLGSVCAPISL